MERKPEIVQENEVTLEPEPPTKNIQLDAQNGSFMANDKIVEIVTETEDNTCIVAPQ